MKSKNEQLTKYQRAQKRVAQIKGFYNHVAAYVVVNTLLLLFREKFVFVLLSKQAIGNPEFLEWIDWNVFGTPIVWGIGLLIHGIYVFNSGSLKPAFVKKWEERQIEKYMKENSNP